MLGYLFRPIAGPGISGSRLGDQDCAEKNARKNILMILSVEDACSWLSPAACGFSDMHACGQDGVSELEMTNLGRILARGLKFSLYIGLFYILSK